MRIVYLAHPVAGDVVNNLARAKRWLFALQDANHDVVIVAPWIPMVEVGNDADPEIRATGLKRCCVMVARCDGLVLVGGRVSSGMLLESKHNDRVWDFTALGDNPPTDNDQLILRWRHKRVVSCSCTECGRGKRTLPAIQALINQAGRALTVSEIIIAANGNLPTRSSTPDSIVARDLSMAVKCSADSRFKRVAPGTYTTRELLEADDAVSA